MLSSNIKDKDEWPAQRYIPQGWGDWFSLSLMRLSLAFSVLYSQLLTSMTLSLLKWKYNLNGQQLNSKFRSRKNAFWVYWIKVLSFQKTKQTHFPFKCHFCLLTSWNKTFFRTCRVNVAQIKSNETVFTKRTGNTCCNSIFFQCVKPWGCTNLMKAIINWPQRSHFVPWLDCLEVFWLLG